MSGSAFCKTITMDVDIVFTWPCSSPYRIPTLRPTATWHQCSRHPQHVQAARENGVGRFIHTSTSQVYGTASMSPSMKSIRCIRSRLCRVQNRCRCHGHELLSFLRFSGHHSKAFQHLWSRNPPGILSPRSSRRSWPGTRSLRSGPHPTVT